MYTESASPPVASVEPSSGTELGVSVSGASGTPAMSAQWVQQPGGSTWLLEHCARAPRHARRLASSAMARWDLAPDAADAVVLIVSELVTNAVEYALPPLVLHLRREGKDQRVWVAVSDAGPAAPEAVWATARDADEHGRGLAVVAALAAAHGTRTVSGATMHWARVHAAAVVGESGRSYAD